MSSNQEVRGIFREFIPGEFGVVNGVPVEYVPQLNRRNNPDWEFIGGRSWFHEAVFYAVDLEACHVVRSQYGWDLWIYVPGLSLRSRIRRWLARYGLCF